MFRIIQIGFILLCWSIASVGQTDVHLHVKLGPTEPSLPVVKRAESKRFQDSASLILYLQKIHDIYLSEGYLECSLDSVEWIDSGVNARLTTGPRYSMSHIKVPEDTLYNGRRSRRNDHREAPFTVRGWEEMNAQWVNNYENRGYPFVRVELNSVKLTSGIVYGEMRIEPGPFVRIDSIINRTEFPLNPQVLSRMIGVYRGMAYNEKAIGSIPGRLKTLPFIEEKRPSEVGFSQDGAWLYLYPEKLASNRFDGWAGFTSGKYGSSSVGFMGSLDLQLYNLLKQGEMWVINWGRTQDRSQQIRAGVQLPYFMGMPFGMALEFNLRRQDTSYLNLQTDGSIPYYLTPGHHLDLFLRYRQSDLLVDRIERPEIEPFSIFLTGLSYGFDRRNDLVNPSAGFLILGDVATGKKRMVDVDTLSQTEFNGKIQYFQPVSKRVVVVPTVQSGWKWGASQIENDRFRLGGYQSIRGFDEDAFTADGFLIGNMEIRYLLDQQAHLLAFGDLGFLFNQGLNEASIRKLLGFGVGGQFRTGGGIFRILFGLGKLEGEPIRLQSGKIHIGYVGLF